MGKKRIETKTPAPVDFYAAPESICIGEATLPYCPVNNGWMLPAGPKQRKRVIKSKANAVYFATQLHQEIKQQQYLRGLSE